MNTHETYVSLEVAKLLKEAGFDWYVEQWYEVLKNGQEMYAEGMTYNMNCGLYGESVYSMPTLSIAQRWLREIENIDVYIFPTTNTKRECVYQVGIKTFGREMWIPGQPSDAKYYTYEEAQEEGIKKALELILEKDE